MMYDELIERLRETSIDFGESDHVSVMLIEAADAIEDLSKTLDEEVEINTALRCNMPVWIPVTERLPDVWKHVITFDEDDGVRVNFRCGDNVSWSFGYHVTHWMPLPQPPESEGE